MKPYNIYFIEFSFRIFYNLISYLLCLFIIFCNINTIFLFETNPLLENLIHKRLIITKITQLFNTIWFTTIFISSLFSFPLVLHHIKTFLNTSWYMYQIKLLTKSFYFILFSFTSFYFINHLILTPFIISFFLYWEITDINSFLRIEAEISLFYYILWNLTFKFNLTFILTNIYFFFKLVFQFTNTKRLYYLISKYKKTFIFLFLCCLFIIIPPDFITQVFATILLYIFFDFIFLGICTKLYVKLQTIKTNNGNNKTVTKRT